MSELEMVSGMMIYGSWRRTHSTFRLRHSIVAMAVVSLLEVGAKMQVRFVQADRIPQYLILLESFGPANARAKGQRGARLGLVGRKGRLARWME